MNLCKPLCKFGPVASDPFDFHNGSRKSDSILDQCIGHRINGTPCLSI